MGLRNGRGKARDSNGMVVYESFAARLDEESKAPEAAHAEATAWIDSDTARLFGSHK